MITRRRTAIHAYCGITVLRLAIPNPSTGKEFKFFTLADEFGHVDVILRPPIYQRYRQVANLEPILIMDGRLQKQDGVLSVLVDHVEAAPSLPDEDVFPSSRNYR